jgi:hypothetical protein
VWVLRDGDWDRGDGAIERLTQYGQCLILIIQLGCFICES